MTADPQVVDSLRSAVSSVMGCSLSGTVRTVIVDTMLARVVQHERAIGTLWTALAAGAGAAVVGAFTNFLFNRGLEQGRRKAERESRVFMAKHEAYTAIAPVAQAVGDSAQALALALQEVESHDHTFHWLKTEIDRMVAGGTPPSSPGIQLYRKLMDSNRWFTLSQPLRAKADSLQTPMKLLEDNFERSELVFPGFRKAVEELGLEHLNLFTRCLRLSESLLKPSEGGVIHNDRGALLQESKLLSHKAFEFGSFATDLLRELENDMYGPAIGKTLPYRMKAPGSRILTRDGFRTVEELDAANPNWRDDVEKYRRAIGD